MMQFFPVLDKSMPNITFLEQLNTHPRDERLQFVAETHTYYVDGVRTLGSATGLIHSFAQEFDEGQVIGKMIQGRNWPRPGYLKLPVEAPVLSRLRAESEADALAQALQHSDTNDAEICELVRHLLRRRPDLHDLLAQLSLTPDEIKAKWSANRIEAANRGTWMHYCFEVVCH